MKGRVTSIFTNYKLEPYVVSKLSKHERSVFAQFCCGTQSNLIEMDVSVMNEYVTIFVYCSEQCIDDEKHFLL